MQFNTQVGSTSNGGSEQASSSVDGQFLLALRKMMKKEIEVMVIRTVQQVILPTVADLVRKVVKEEIQSVEKRLSTGGTRNYENEMTMSKERSLQLKFSDEVSVPVLTGKVLQGKQGDSMKVALVDGTTGQVVDSEPESSAKVEILVLDASGDDNEHYWTQEKFNRRIIREGDKKKPHFAKAIYVYLEKGVGILSNAKLGHDSSWMKSCKCRLGARIIENFKGIKVQEGWTESFMVLDSRSKLYEKHHPPSASDEVWRLENIGRDGAPCKRLNEENIWTVQDFLLLLSVDPQRLQRIVGAGTKMWNATVDHARTCVFNGKEMYLYRPSTESKEGVVCDAVGGLKGVVDESHYVPIHNLSADRKDYAYNLLLSAFKNRCKTSFDDEASLLQQFPYRSDGVNASTNSSIQGGSNGSDPTISETTNEYDPTEPVTSSQSISPYIRTLDHPSNINHLGFFDPTSMGQIHEPFLGFTPQFPDCQFPDLQNGNGYAPMDPGTSSQSICPSITTFDIPNSILHSPTMEQLYEANLCVQIPSCQFSCPDFISEPSGDNWSLMSVINPGINNLSKALGAKSHSQEKSNARAYRLVGHAVNAMLWMFRAKKRVMALEGIHVQKRQRT